MDVQVGVPPPPPPPPPPAFFAETTVPPPPPATQPVTTAPPTTTTVNVTSPPTQERIWLHPWTVNEMRDHASQWSLAGDAGVLLYLEQFSDRLTQRADAIQQHLNQTVNAVKSTHTRVLNCLNEFTSLANTQFIENRVYDEDETASSTADASKKDEQSTDKSNINNTEAQEKVLQRYVEAIQYGLVILDTHFERVEPKSDNHTNGSSSFVDDDEDVGGPQDPILEQKDPYIIHRPLPYLIGTKEFMDDDFVGLGDLLIVPDPDVYDVDQTVNLQTDSALSSSDEGEEDDKDFEAEVAPVAIVPAGASRADLPKPQPTKTVLTDSEDEDDPFGIGKNVTRIDPPSSKPAANDDDWFDDEPKKPPPKSEKPPPKPEKPFTLDSDDEDNSSFGLPTKPSQSIIKPDNDFDDKSSTTSDKPEEPEPSKPKALSELEKAVLRRRKQMGDPDIPANDNDDDDDDGFVKKPAATKAKTSSNEPSSSTIFNLTSQPLTAPTKISQPSIFGEDDDDDDNDIFNPKKKLPNVLPTPTITNTKSSQKKEKDMFDDDSDDEGDIFSPKKKPSTPSSLPAKKNDPSPSQPILVNKPKQIALADVSDDDDFFGSKPPPPVIPTPASKKKIESSHSEDDDDDDNDDDDDMPIAPVSKPHPPPTAKIPAATVSDDENPLSTVKPPEAKVTPAPVVLPTIKRPITKLDDDSDDDMFGIPKKTPPPASTTATPPTKVIPPVKLDDDEEELFGTKKATPTKTQVLPTNLSKPKPPAHSDEDEDLFISKPPQVKLPPTVVLPPSPSAPSTKSNVPDDPLGIGISVEPTSPPVVQQTKTSSIPARKSSSSDDEKESSSSNRVLNPGALQEGEKMSVKKFASNMKINPGAFKPGGFKPPARPKANSITEESPKTPVDDDDQPIEKNSPAPIVAKKITTLDSDSDDDVLFGNTAKKETLKPPVIESKEKPTNTNESGKTNIKDLSARLNFNPMAPGAQPKPTPKETNNDTQTTSKDEPVVDKTMINILRDKSKVARPGRAPPSSRRTRPTGAAAAAAAAPIDEDDDLFATPKSTTTTKSPSTPTAVPIIPPPSPAKAPVVPPPSVPAPVTENKTSVVPKPKPTTTTTTTKSTTKASTLPLDDDDDFLSKRPGKKNSKPVADDIFDDVQSKGEPVNKAKKDWAIMNKSDGTDDIFNDTSTKSSSTSKPKATNGKSKPAKNFDDIFNDPLNTSSK